MSAELNSCKIELLKEAKETAVFALFTGLVLTLDGLARFQYGPAILWTILSLTGTAMKAIRFNWMLALYDSCPPLPSQRVTAHPLMKSEM